MIGQSELLHFPKDSFVLVRYPDPRFEDAILVMSSEDGVGFYDLLGPDETPIPMLKGLQPSKVAESINEWHSWFSDISEDLGDKFLEVWEGFTDRNYDVLTIARVLWECVKQQGVDDIPSKFNRVCQLQKQLQEYKKELKEWIGGVKGE